jgi:hypothetical protein
LPQSLTPASHLTRRSGLFYYRRVLPGGTRHQVAVPLKTRRFQEAEHLAEVRDHTFTAAIGQVRLEHPKAIRDEPARHLTAEPLDVRGDFDATHQAVNSRMA